MESKEFLEYNYIDLQKTSRQIAEQIGTSHNNILNWLKKYEIPTRKNKCNIIGEGNINWKGDEVGYVSLHYWVRKRKPKPIVCENCGKESKLELSNISGEYKRDVDDYQYLCLKCHCRFDIENGFYGNSKKKYKGELL